MLRLEPGTIKAIYNCERNSPLFNEPVIQIASISTLFVGDSNKQRYKGNVSDGKHYMKAVFSSELCPLFENGELRKNYLIKLDTFSVRPKENNIYLYVQSILEKQPMDRELGSPVNIYTGKSSADNYPGKSSADNYTGKSSFTKEHRESENHENTPIGSRSSNDRAESRSSNDRAESRSSSDRPGGAFKYKTQQGMEEASKKHKAADVECIKIKDLNPFISSWKITGRINSKSEIKSFTSQKGEGRLFSFTIVDATAELKCVAFSDCVEPFYSLIEIGSVYSISNGTVKMANKRYSNTNFDYELQLERTTVIKRTEDTPEIPTDVYNFVEIGRLAPDMASVDVIGMISDVYPVRTITLKTDNRTVPKRDFILIDKTGQARLTLWGEKAEAEYLPGKVMCIKSAKVKEYNGISLSASTGSVVIYDQYIPEAVELCAWYKAEGHGIGVAHKAPTKKRTISEIIDNEQEYGTVDGVILYVKEEGICYPSCPADGCSKKVTIEGESAFRCERCNYVYETCNYRYMLSLNIGDYTGQMWMTGFDEVGKSLFGMSSDELRAAGAEDPSRIQRLVKDLVGKEFLFKIRTKTEMFNGMPKPRTTASEIHPVSREAAISELLGAVEKVQSS